MVAGAPDGDLPLGVPDRAGDPGRDGRVGRDLSGAPSPQPPHAGADEVGREWDGGGPVRRGQIPVRERSERGGTQLHDSDALRPRPWRRRAGLVDHLPILAEQRTTRQAGLRLTAQSRGEPGGRPAVPRRDPASGGATSGSPADRRCDERRVGVTAEHLSRHRSNRVMAGRPLGRVHWRNPRTTAMRAAPGGGAWPGSWPTAVLGRRRTRGEAIRRAEGTPLSDLTSKEGSREGSGARGWPGSPWASPGLNHKAGSSRLGAAGRGGRGAHGGSPESVAPGPDEEGRRGVGQASGTAALVAPSAPGGRSRRHRPGQEPNAGTAGQTVRSRAGRGGWPG